MCVEVNVESPKRPVLSVVAALMVSVVTVGASLRGAEPDEAYQPKIAPASDEGERAIPQIRVPKGFKVELWAAEPLLANPVALCIDEKGRIYVAETFRQLKGVEDNRDHMNWLDDDLAAMTVEDRLDYFKKHLGQKIESYGKEHDQIRLLEDTDGNGKADTATLFAGGFRGILEGTGAGVLARKGTVYYTNIPNVWSLRDDTGDGTADTRAALHTGYGVRVAFRGHDSHGLRFGPDGRLYFSIGDRGFNVQTKEQERLFYPDQGAVLRCNPDGTELEVVHAGLRNPQELAFDEFGNLFTGDNNSDSGDRARWVYVTEGADSGWRMSLQYLADRGPWNREKLWHPQHDGQAAFIVPPLANLADGPSGLTYAPGIGFPGEYQGRFYLCDFRGAAQGSGIRSVRLEPKGAAFEVVENKEFAWQVLATDVDFGPDGSMYLTDWVEGWNGPGKGRIYRISPDSMASNPIANQTRELMSAGFAGRPPAELESLLSHPSQAVRQEAQFAIAELPLPQAAGHFLNRARDTIATSGPDRLARLHGIWGLGQAYRAHVRANGPISARQKQDLFGPVIALLSDPDVEVRSQAAKVLGECRQVAAIAPLMAALGDPESRVRFFAAIALGKVARLDSNSLSKVADALVTVLRDNADRDPYLRHAAVMGLAGLNSALELNRHVRDPNASVRLGLVLALRKLRRADVAQFLGDAEPRVVEEAARAIYDVPLGDGMTALAGLAGRTGLTEPTLYRVIAANFRLGTPAAAVATASIASRGDVPAALRIEAAKALGDWAKPSGRDRVLGLWRPVPPRDAEIAVAAIRSHLAGMLSGDENVRRSATEAAVKLGIKEIGATLLALVLDAKEPPAIRADAVRSLALLKDSRLDQALPKSLDDTEPIVRAAGLRVLAQQDAPAALRRLPVALEKGELVERQSAAATLGEMNADEAQKLLGEWLDRIPGGDVPAGLILDLLEAGKRRNQPALSAKLEAIAKANANDPLADFKPALVGGDAERGRRLFYEKGDVYCVRCHKITNRGGEVGPDLTKVAGQHPRDYLLESIVVPDKAIAKGFEPVVILTTDGKQINGTLREEDADQVKLITAEGNIVVVKKTDIDERARGKSAMPEDLVKKLSKFELRDLVEYLSTLK